MKAAYDYKLAGKFWARRLKSTNPLSAVLTFDAPEELNKAYDFWEKQSLANHMKTTLAGKKVLDLGCGTGRIALPFARKGANITALDCSKGMLEHLKHSARKARLISRINCVLSSSEYFESPDNFFDIIICFGLLEHLPETPRRRTMREACRTLKRTGRMYTIVNNSDNIFLKECYQLKKQKRDGYFVSLVGLEWLDKVCKKNKMKMKVAASNPFYSLVHYYLYPQYEIYFKSHSDFKKLCKLISFIDCADSHNVILSKLLASHFMVEITHHR